MSRQHKYILALRAYGDFTILLNALQHAAYPSEYHVIASTHLKPLYEALRPYLKLDVLSIEFKEIGIRHSLLGLFTNRYLFNANTYRELKQLQLVLNSLPAGDFYVEQDYRKWLLSILLQKKCSAIAGGHAVYASYADFFRADYPIISDCVKPSRVLILPTARQKFRNIPSADILNIKKTFADTAIVQTGFYAGNQIAALSENDFVYASFQELVAQIMDSELVFCPDSLQAHLCQLLGKPHYILHPKGLSEAFFTPHVMHFKKYKVFGSSYLNQ